MAHYRSHHTYEPSSVLPLEVGYRWLIERDAWHYVKESKGDANRTDIDLPTGTTSMSLCDSFSLYEGHTVSESV